MVNLKISTDFTKDELLVSSNRQIKKFFVFDAAGRALVREKYQNAKQFRIPLQTHSGLYFVKAGFDNGDITNRRLTFRNNCFYIKKLNVTHYVRSAFD